MAAGKKGKPSATEVVKEIKRRTRRVFSSEEKIMIVLEGLRGKGLPPARIITIIYNKSRLQQRNNHLSLYSVPIR